MVKTVTATFNTTNVIADTMVSDYTAQADKNYGAYAGMWVEKASTYQRTTLMRFNLSALAGKYASIERITLKLTEHDTVISYGAGPVRAHRILSGNKDWVEGTSTGVAAENGLACWLYKAYSATAPTNWAGNSPGPSVAGTDYDATALGSFYHNNTADAVYYLSLAPADAALRKDLVDQWSGSQSDNAGVLLIADPASSHALYLCSSEQATEAKRPVLTVEYVPAGPSVAVFTKGVDGYTGAEDTQVLQAFTTYNYGTYPTLQLFGTTYQGGGNTRRTLMRFNLGVLARLYTGIDSLVLTNLVQSGKGGENPGGTLAVHRISKDNKDWVEGTKNHALATDGESCWSYKAYSATAPTSWAGSAGLSTAGTDYESVALGSAALPDVTSTNYNYGVTLAASDPALRRELVNEWSGPKAGNAGILLGIWGTNTAFYTHFSDTTDATKRPRLEVAYTPESTKTATFRNGVNGYAGMQDTCVMNVSGNTNNNFGLSPRLDCNPSGGTRKTLLRFDLSALRGRYRAVRRVRLTLTDSPETPSTSVAGTVTAYRITQANKAWVAGTATATNGAVALAGEACWSYKAYPATGWAGSAGLSTAGTDYETVALGSLDNVVMSGGPFTLELGNAKSLVDEWSGPQAANAGLLLTATTPNLYLCSSDHATVAVRPLLEVEYVPIKGTLIRIR
jgi:hypothetical protein